MMTNTDTEFEILRLSIFLLISILNIKSECSKVLFFNPNPSEPNNKTFFPFQSFFVKFF